MIFIHPHSGLSLFSRIAAAVVALAIAGSAGAVTQLGAKGGEIRAIRFTTATALFAGTQGGGLYTSSDSGANFAKVATFPGKYVWAIAQDGAGTLFVASGEGLFKSTDGATGNAWSQLTHDDTRAVAVSGSGPTATVLAGVRGAGIIRSTNGGATFADFSAGLDYYDVRAIVFSGADAFAAISDFYFPDPLNFNIVGPANVGGVFKATTAATAPNWTSMNSPGDTALSSKFIVALALDSAGTIFAGSRDGQIPGKGGIHRLPAPGNSWVNFPPDVFDRPNGDLGGIESLAVDNNGTTTNVWAGTEILGPFKWNGSTWSWQMDGGTGLANPELYSAISAIGVSTTATRVVVGSRGVGLFTTGTGNFPYTHSNGLAAERVMSFSTTALNTYYLGLRTGGVMRSTDGGTNWGFLNNGIFPFFPANPNISYLQTINTLAANPNNASEAYLAVEGLGIYKWNGTTWAGPAVGPNPTLITDTGVPAFPTTPMGMAYTNNASNVIFSNFFFGGGVYFRNAGNAWSLVQSGPFGGAGIGRLTVSNGIPNKAFAVAPDEYPYYSTNAGAIWTQVPAVNAPHTGFMPLGFYAITDIPSNGFIVIGATNKGLFKSTDGGLTWARLSIAGTGLTRSALMGVTYTTNGSLWAVSRDGQFFCSPDDGASWSSIAQPFAANVVDVAVRGNTVLILTDGAGLLQHDSTGLCI